MRIYDISRTLPDTPVYPGDPPTVLTRLLRVADGAPCNLTQISASLHAGTHADAPFHFLDGGPAVESLPPEVFVGPAYVAEIAKAAPSLIDRDDLAGLSIAPGQRLLVKTYNSDRHGTSFAPDYCSFTPEAACYLVQRGVRLIGIDGPSVGRDEGSTQVHRTLLGAGIGILEGLALAGIGQGSYFLSAAPVKIRGVDGSPVRALLIRFDAGDMPR